MKIAIALSHLGGGGLERNALKQAAWLAGQGHHVTLLNFGCELSFPCPDRVDAVRLSEPRTPVRLCLDLSRVGVSPAVFVRVLAVNSQFSSSAAFYPSLIGFLQQRNIDLLISHKWELTVFCVAAKYCHSPSLSLIAWEHGEAVWTRPGRSVLRLRRDTFPSADRIVAVSKGLAAKIEDLLGLSKGRVTPIYQPTLNDSIESLQPDRCDIEGLKSRECAQILSIGRIHPVKGYDILIRAFAMVLDHLEARLTIAGPDTTVNGRSHSETLKELCHQLGVASSVTISGPTHQSISCMALCDVFVVSSRSEGLPNTMVEALAAGTSIVATDCSSGIREVLGDSEFGVVVAVEDPGALADGILSALAKSRTSDELRRRVEPFRASHHFAALDRIIGSFES